MDQIQGSRSSTGRAAFLQSITSTAVIFFSLFFSISSLSFAAPAEFAVGPDSNLELLLKTFDSAQKSIVVNIYEFEHDEIADHLIEKIRDGIDVSILFETEPCCKQRMSPEAKAIVRRIHSEMRKSTNPRSRIYLMGSRLRRARDTGSPTAADSEVRRFAFNHAKYVIVDGSRVHMASENFTPTGHAARGTKGNRGWDFAVEDSALANKLMAIYRKDTASGSPDVLMINPRTTSLPGWLRNDGTVSEPREIESRTQRRVAVGRGVVSNIELVTSPNAMPGVAKMMNSASTRLDLQFMSMPTNWGRAPNMLMNPIVDTAVDLAKKGVQIRFLLNDDRAFQEGQVDYSKAAANDLTVAYLRRIAQCRNLPIDAKVIDTKAAGITYIHNKAIIVDYDRVFVSSINGTQNSVENNRETALSVLSTDANAYYSRVFDSDWSVTSRAHSDRATAAANARVEGCPPVTGEPIEFKPSTTPRMKSWLSFY